MLEQTDRRTGARHDRCTDPAPHTMRAVPIKTSGLYYERTSQSVKHCVCACNKTSCYNKCSIRPHRIRRKDPSCTPISHMVPRTHRSHIQNGISICTTVLPARRYASAGTRPIATAVCESFLVFVELLVSKPYKDHISDGQTDLRSATYDSRPPDRRFDHSYNSSQPIRRRCTAMFVDDCNASA